MRFLMMIYMLRNACNNYKKGFGGREVLEVSLLRINKYYTIGLYMKIIESFIRGKNPDQSLCEDGIFIGAKIAAVIDGVTSKGSLS